MPEYEAVVGLEVHAQSSTGSKMFCWCSNDSFGKEPNINVCPICMGHPGQLPAINEEAVKKGILTALALNCSIAPFTRFDRKNYFYPDLPKGYQISQFDQPLACEGYLEICVNGVKKRIGITRLHLEDDAGKLTHIAGGTLVDFNRSGAPLMEIVSEPDIRSAEEAVIYAQELQKILRAIGSSLADMEKGMMRFDINVSVRKRGESKFGTKVEVKNLNSFKFLEKALNYEIERQVNILSDGGSVAQETRGWDEEGNRTLSQRSKEEAHDYRYFPEPDLPPLIFSEKYIAGIRRQLPELPASKKMRYIKDFSLSEADADIFTELPKLGIFFEQTVKFSNDSAKSAALLLSVLVSFSNKNGCEIDDLAISPKDLANLIIRANAGDLSMSAIKVILEEMFETGKSSDEIISEKNLLQISDPDALAKMCDKVVQLNHESVKDYLEGKERAFGFLVGQVMKESAGRANPQMVSDLLKQKLK